MNRRTFIKSLAAAMIVPYVAPIADKILIAPIPLKSVDANFNKIIETTLKAYLPKLKQQMMQQNIMLDMLTGKCKATTISFNEGIPIIEPLIYEP